MPTRMKLKRFMSHPLSNIDDETLDFVDFWRFHPDGDLDRAMYAFGTCVSELVMYSDERLDALWAQFIVEREP